MDESIPSEYTLLLATCVGLQNKIKTRQETLKLRSVVLKKKTNRTQNIHKTTRKPNQTKISTSKKLNCPSWEGICKSCLMVLGEKGHHSASSLRRSSCVQGVWSPCWSWPSARDEHNFKAKIMEQNLQYHGLFFFCCKIFSYPPEAEKHNIRVRNWTLVIYHILTSRNPLLQWPSYLWDE